MAAAATNSPRCLSDLLDDLLLRILSFLPAKDAAATAVLSRRWRTLWLTSGAVYLDSSTLAPSSWSSKGNNWNRYERTQAKDLEGFHAAVDKALAAAAVPIKKLTFVVKTDSLVFRPDMMLDHDLVAAALSMPAARHVEELQVENQHRVRRPLPLNFASLPSQSLRVLRLVGFPPMAAAPPAAFPRLAKLHLNDCAVVPLVALRPIVDAAPQLATLHLESCCVVEKNEHAFHMPVGMAAPPVQVQVYRLVCPAVTDLVFEKCNFQGCDFSLELDVPRLQSFRYFGAVQLCGRLSLDPITQLSMIQVADLHLSDDKHAVIRQVCLPSVFWPFIRNFRAAKVLKLKLDFSMARVALEMSQQDEILFRNLEQLDLDAQYTGRSKASMVTLASLLRGCPVLRDIRLKLRNEQAWMSARSSVDQVETVDFDKSVYSFRHKRSPIYYDDYYYEDFDEIYVLREQSFSCLESSLRRVSLHFCMDRPDCLGVQLAKFFAENARVLEDMHIDDGSHKFCEHMNASVSGMHC